MKLERLICILSLLLDQDKIIAPKLAEHFEVSRRTIQTDIESLCRSGIQIVIAQGAGGGISILRGYHVDRTVLTTPEMQAILAGLRSLDSVSSTRRYAHLMGHLSVGTGGLDLNYGLPSCIILHQMPLLLLTKQTRFQYGDQTHNPFRRRYAHPFLSLAQHPHANRRQAMFHAKPHCRSPVCADCRTTRLWFVSFAILFS